MSNKLMLLAIIFALVLSLGFVVACGDDDDDDDDDDTADDDDDDTCADDGAFEYLMDECGFIFTDTEGADMTLDDLMTTCDSCLIGCYAAYDNCDDMETCICSTCIDC